MRKNKDAGKHQSVSSLSEEYWEKVMKCNGTPGGVRKAYERVRNRDIAGIRVDLELNAMRTSLTVGKPTK